MIYGFIAFAALVNYLKPKKETELPTLVQFDYDFPHAEKHYRLNEVDAIEKELIEIESDLRIQDDISHIREIALQGQKMRLKAHLARHKNRLNEMSF
jgi:hypothetical protein